MKYRFVEFVAHNPRDPEGEDCLTLLCTPSWLERIFLGEETHEQIYYGRGSFWYEKGKVKQVSSSLAILLSDFRKYAKRIARI